MSDDGDDSKVIPFPKGYRHLGDGFLMDERRSGIWRRNAKGGVYPFGPGGAPIVLRHLMPAEAAAQTHLASSEVQLLLCWRSPNGRETRAEWWSAEDVRKGHYLDRLGIRDTGRPAVDLWAKLILGQLDAFPDQIPAERLIRYAGLADDGASRTWRDGRTVFDDGSVEPGEVGNGTPLLGPRRAERWRARFQDFPEGLPDPDRLADACAALLAFDPKGRALCAAMLGVRALFYSLADMGTFVLLTGLRGTGKTTIGQIMHWAEGPCAADDEPDLAFRSTALGAELVAERVRDGVFLIDDLQRTHAAPGASLEPHALQLVTVNGRAAFDRAPLRIRGNRHLTLAPSRRVAQLLAFSAETAMGLEPSLVARSIWWPFEAGEISFAPMVASDRQETQTWRTCQEAFTAIGHAVSRHALGLAHAGGRGRAADFIRGIDAEAAELVGSLDIGGEPEDRARIAWGVSMIVAGGMLCDYATLDNTMRDLALTYAGQLARAQAGRISTGQLDGGGFDPAWFRTVYEGLDALLFDAETGRPFLDGEAYELHSIGYHLDERTGSPVPARRKPAGWRHRAKAEDWLLPAAFLEACERRARALSMAFPFTAQTLPAHLARIGFTRGGAGGRHAHRVRIGKELARVLRVPLAEPRRGPASGVPAVPASTFAAGTDSPNDFNVVPAVPAVPARNPRVARAPARAREAAPAVTEGAEPDPKYWRERLAVWGSDALLIGEPSGQITGVKHGAGKGVPSKTHLLDLMREHRITQLWLHPSAVDGLPASLKGGGERDGMAHRWADPAELPAGWGMKKAGRLKPWMKFYRLRTSGTVAISVPHLDERVRWEAGSPESLLRACLLLKDTLGVSYKSGPGSFFQDIVIRSRRRGAFEATIAPAEFPTAWRGSPDIAPSLAWERPLSADERTRGFVLRYDLNGAFLYAMNRRPLGIGRPVHAEGMAFDAKRAGLWFATVEGEARPDLPHPCYRTGHHSTNYRDTWAWYPTAQLASAEAHGLAVHVAEAWLYPETRPMLEQTYAKVRDALASFNQLADAGDEAAAIAISVLKDARTRGLGWFDMEQDRDADEPADLHRPDWYAELRAGAAAHLLRQLGRAAAFGHATPFAIAVDAVWFASDVGDPVSAATELGLPLGRRLGVFKPDGFAELPQLLPMLARPGAHLRDLSRAMRAPPRPAAIAAALRAADAAAAERRA